MDNSTDYRDPRTAQQVHDDAIKADAELRLGPVKPAVITVPAFFDDPRRKGTQDAGRIAGLDHGHFGVKVHRSEDRCATWTELTYPAFPEGETASTRLLWTLEPGPPDQPGVL